MNLENAKLFYVLSCIALGLVILSPTLFAVAPFPEGKRFSELVLLGPNHMIESVAFNVSLNKPSTVYLGVGNHMGESEYYTVYVKLRNQTQPLPVASNSSPSMLPVLYEFDVFVGNDDVWEKPLDFAVSDVSTVNDSMLLRSLQVNGFAFQVDEVSLWDEERSGFYYQLFSELWYYNMTLSSFQYHNRFVGLWLC